MSGGLDEDPEGEKPRQPGLLVLRVAWRGHLSALLKTRTLAYLCAEVLILQARTIEQPPKRKKANVSGYL